MGGLADWRHGDLVAEVEQLRRDRDDLVEALKAWRDAWYYADKVGAETGAAGLLGAYRRGNALLERVKGR